MKGNSPQNSRVKRVIRLALFCVGILALVYFFEGVIGRLGAVITTPMYAVTSWFHESTAPLPQYLRDRSELLSEIDRLKKELAARTGSDAVIGRLAGENEALRSLLGNGDESPRIAAGVIARPPGIPYDALLIDQGSVDGIEEGTVVYHAHDETIGFVSKVFEKSALVTLFSTPGVKGTAYIFGPNIFVRMFGEGGGVLRLSVPQGISIKVGDVVVLPTLEAGILGLVSEVRSVPTEPEQEAFVTFERPIQSIYRVAVSTRKLESITFEEAERFIAAWEYHALGIDIPITPYPTQGATSSTSTAPQ